MLNVNRITTVLARMPDVDLQKYAEMHKSDPYIMALAMSESNRRKETRTAGQGAQEEKPKVVDQILAEMVPRQPMPEEMGIGALPAPNMTMANGGIVGYDEGGMVAFARGGDVERYFGGGDTAIYDPVTGVPISSVDTAGDDRTLLERFGVFNPENRRALEKGAAERAAPALAKDVAPNVVDAPVVPPATKTLSTSLNTRSAAPAKFDSIEDLQKKIFGGLDTEKADVTKRREDLASGLKSLAESNLSEEQARIAADSDLFKNKDARLAKQERGLAGLDQRNIGLAIFKMGATMMGTRGGLAAAIGAGAGVGAEAYASGIAKIDLAKDKFAEAQDRLDNLKINRNDMNAKELRAAKKGVKEAELQGMKLFQEGAEKDLGIKRQELSSVFTAAANELNADKNRATQKDIAGMQLSEKENDPRMQVFRALVAKYGGDVLKANAELQTMGEGTIQGLYKKELVKKLAELETSPSGAMLPAQQENIARIKKELFGGSFATPSPEAIAFLKANPNSAAQFNAKFNNTSAQYLR